MKIHEGQTFRGKRTEEKEKKGGIKDGKKKKKNVGYYKLYFNLENVKNKNK